MMQHVEGDITERHLLQCVVEVAKAALRAEAASVFLVDDETGDLAFAAVAGRGEDTLVGRRFPGDTGIAGWAVASGQPMLADDLTDSPFSQSAAEQTGYVPRSVAAAPLYHDGRCVGVLEVLDRTGDRDELDTLDLLGLLASQAALGLELLQRLHRDRRDAARRAGTPAGAPATASNTALIDRIASGLPNLTADEATLLGEVLAVADRLTDRAAARATGT